MIREGKITKIQKRKIMSKKMNIINQDVMILKKIQNKEEMMTSIDTKTGKAT
jgi:hypothetical protein